MRWHKMKKITIILIVMFVLLSFVKFSCLAEDLFNYAELWNSLSSYEKGILILGVGSGIEKCVEDFIDWFSSFVKEEGTKNEKKEMKLKDWLNLKITEKGIKEGEEDIKREVGIYLLEYQVEYYRTFLWDDSDFVAQIRITSELYDMYFLASRKLRGEPIDLLLGELRKKALP
jgi:hypothetical protein